MRQQGKRLTAALLALLMLLVCLPVQVFAAAGWDGESVSEPSQLDGAYQISTAEELCWFARQVNDGAKINAALTDDIDLNNQPGEAIGTTSNPFGGTFNGAGNEIQNLKIDTSAANKGGLFGKNEGTIHNLKVSGSISGKGNTMGGITAWNAGGTVEGCESAVTIENTKANANNIGGVIGQNTLGGMVKNCLFSGSVTAATGGQVGGIVGRNTSSFVSGCVNTGTVVGANNTLATNTGGIVGRWELSGANSRTAIYNCYNTGMVKAGSPNGSVGGIVGLGNATSSQSGSQFTLINCYHVGEITGATQNAIIASLPNSDYAVMHFFNNYFLAENTDYAAGAVSESDLKSPDFVARLNGNNGSEYGLTIPEDQLYVKSEAYPLLSWQSEGEPQPSVVPVVFASVSGTAKEGETLSAVALGENDAAATNVTYQWQISSAESEGYCDIPGATQQTFVIPADGSCAGKRILVIAYGEEASSAVSEPTAPIEKADEAIVAEDREALSLDASGVIREATTISLPQAGKSGSKIRWTSSDEAVIDPVTGRVTLPKEGIACVTLTAAITKGAAKDSKAFSFQVYSRSATAAEQAQEYLERAKNALENSWYQLKPVYGRDENVNDYVRSELERLGYPGITVAVKETANPDYIGQDGSIAYFYADPNGFSAMWFAQVGVTFTFSKDGASVEHQKNAVIYWDQERARQTMQREIADQVTESVVKAENESLDSVYTDLTLPKVVDNKKWSLISWESSDSDVIEIDSSNQSTADTLFHPYIGKVKQGTADQTVTLTATFHFQLANTTYGEAPIEIQKVFTVTVKAIGSDLEERMQSLLDTYYTTDKITCFGTKDAIDPANIITDLQLPIPRSTGIPDYSDYTFAVTSGDTDVIEISAYRSNVYRPLPGDSAKVVTLTVAMSHRDYHVTVTKEFVLTVSPLTQAEITQELRLMEAAKAGYFDGLNNGANQDAAHVSKNLHAFQKVRFDANGGLEWVYTAAETNGIGIIPVSIDVSHPSEQWDRFKSSAPQVITHENLLVIQPEYNKAVTITSCLSSERFERYALRYPAVQDFQKLYRQEVAASVTVLGEKGEGGSEAEQLTVSLTLAGDQAHGASGHAEYELWLENLPATVEEGTPVSEIFQKVLSANGYTWEGSGYIRSVTTPDGIRLAEKANGANSGWMYAVNGVISDVYADTCYPEDGDEIVWFYTDDPAKDPRIDGKQFDLSKGMEPVEPDDPTPDPDPDPDAPVTELTSEWPNFRGSDTNNGLTISKTPRSAAEAALRWMLPLKAADDWTTAVSQPILVDGKLIVAVGNELLAISKAGDVTARAKLADSINSTCRPLYAEGRIVVPINGGRMQAVSAESFRALWVTDPVSFADQNGYTDPQESLSTVTYSDGYVYMGTVAIDSCGAYLCVDLQTGKTVWAYQNREAGYYWSGAAHTETSIAFAGDDGVLQSRNAKTGELIDTLDLGAKVRSTAVWVDGYLYLTTIDGALHQIEWRADGTFGVKKSVSFAAYSTGTAAVSNGFAYVGGKTDEEKGMLSVIDIRTMQVVTSVSTPAEVKSAPLVATGYEGETYVYFTANTTPGGIYMYKHGADRADVLVAPAAEASNYCISSVIADESGALYLINDSGILLSAGGEAEPVTYSVSVQAGKGGSVSPVGIFTVTKGSSFTIRITPDEGYQVDQIRVNGKAVSSKGLTYTIGQIQSDYEIEVSFVAVSAGSTGTTPSDKQPDTTTPDGQNPDTGDDYPAAVLAVLLLSSATAVLFTARKKSKVN